MDSKKHFKNEEKILSNTSYPLLFEHKEVHKELLEKATHLLNLYSTGEVNKTEILSYFVFDLIAKHLLEMDIGYFKYIK